MSSFPVRRNTMVLGIVLFLLAVFAWAGWANWAYRKEEAARRAAAQPMQGMLVPDASGTALEYVSPLENKPAPNFTLTDIQGKTVSLDSYRGKAVLINFWATWCGPCRLETPWLVDLQKKYGAKGFEVLGIDTEGDDAKPGSEAWKNDESLVKKFVAQMKMPYPVLVGGDSLARPYGGLDNLPTSFYVNRKGIVVAAQVGIDSESAMEANIQKAMTD